MAEMQFLIAVGHTAGDNRAFRKLRARNFKRLCAVLIVL